MALNGIICINKPQGFTSFDAVAKLRGILKTRKLGHGGTLDPMATGVLPIFAGKATKACDMLPDSGKVYEAGFVLGQVTDTQDITGSILEEKSTEGISENDILSVLDEFRGDIMQVPPMYSAVSQNGVRLYKLARQGVVVEREARPINISELILLDFDDEKKSGHLRISCSKGTYIRTLINDIGEKLGCGGVMSSLIRVKAAGFTLEDCYTFEQLEKMDNFDDIILSVEKAFGFLPKLQLTTQQAKMYRNGVRLNSDRIEGAGTSERFTVFDGDIFLGTATVDRSAGELITEKNFYVGE